jgi:hypothetical protein
MLLEIVQKEIPSADQGLVDRVLKELGSSEESVIKEKVIASFIARCRNIGQLSEKLNRGPQPPKTAVKVADPEPSAKTTPDAVELSPNELLDSIANDGNAQLSGIYSEALRRANELEAIERDADIDALAAQIVEMRRSARKEGSDFLKVFGQRQNAHLSARLERMMPALPQGELKSADVEVEVMAI